MSNSKNRNAEHNLIFAGLGLQLGIIAKDKVIRAFTEWLFDKARPLGEILVHQKAITPEQRKTLESAVEAHIQQEGGEQKALASLNHVKDLESDLDHLADNDLNQSLDGAVTQRKLMGLDVLFTQSHDSESSSTNIKGTFSGPESKQTDRFERQHFLDSGNLGEVFFAKDTELNRTVVTKYIRPEMSGDTLKQALFHLEGEVTGSLEHPSVVAVYGLGKDTKGRLYYAMRYVRGKKLSRVIAEYHRKEAGLKQEALTGLLQNFQAVCLAIEYAHSKGVLHCDIKPDNIMIGDYGEVFVVDWGLVVVCGDVKGSSDMHQMETLDPGVIPPYRPSELASSGLHEQQGGSRRGVGGTPAYMAPEQFTATMSEDISLVTPKADIYALGATLYHILTGKAPHLPKEGVKESPDAFYFRITTGMIPTPREKDASIPKLLEQIVLKAIQVEPDDRYVSARELAEDIKRYVSDEPVHAYQESGLEKARRWVRKNRALVGTVMLMATMVALSFMFVTSQFNKELIKERDRANKNEKNAQERLVDIGKAEAEVEVESKAYKARFNEIEMEIDSEMVLIPADNFKMMTPVNESHNEVTKPYYMGKYEVTQEQWEGVMGKNLSRVKGIKLPVTDVSWEDCKEFIKKLNVNKDRVYRLPTEAEWKYACRAGTTTAYSFGDEITPKDANYKETNIGVPIAVGSYKPNAFGLYDMHGNVWEWCEDRFGPDQVESILEPEKEVDQVLCGGSYRQNGNQIRRSSFRITYSQTGRFVSDFGFRLARTVNIKTEEVPAVAKPDPVWQLNQADESKKYNQLYAEMFHLKQLLEINPSDNVIQLRLKECDKNFPEFLKNEKLIIEKIALEMVLISGGKFMMGSPVSEKGHRKEETKHEVTLSKPFYMGKYEVTQEQWQAVMGNNPSEIKGFKLPVTSVSWVDCQGFIKKLNEKTNGGYRLPTEAEWEYACRAGTNTSYSYGDSITKNDANVAWGTSIKVVGSYKPNAFGLYDMHGNVWEWCEDWKVDYPKESVIDPKGPAKGKYRLLRGGSFTGPGSHSRAANWWGTLPTTRDNDYLGFRLAREISIDGLSEPDIKELFLILKMEQEKRVKKEEEEVKIKKEAEEAKIKEAQKKAALILHKEVEVKTELEKSINLEMVLIPSGKFMMGSPASEKGRSKVETQHEVTLTKPYYMGKYEVTQEQYEAVMGNNPSSTKGAKLPVTEVSWYDCHEFIKKLNAKTNGGYRLPTEAEWEYACRVGTTTVYSFGTEITPKDANYGGSTIGTPTVVGSYKPNAFGLYDMHGNVWEWCEDWFKELPQGTTIDPKGPAMSDGRVLRGGSFWWESTVRSSSRADFPPTSRNFDFGFRLARTP